MAIRRNWLLIHPINLDDGFPSIHTRRCEHSTASGSGPCRRSNSFFFARVARFTAALSAARRGLLPFADQNCLMLHIVTAGRCFLELVEHQAVSLNRVTWQQDPR